MGWSLYVSKGDPVPTLTCLRHVQHLELTDVHQVESIIASMLDMDCLETLVLTRVKLSEESIKVLGRLPMLKTLYLYQCRGSIGKLRLGPLVREFEVRRVALVRLRRALVEGRRQVTRLTLVGCSVTTKDLEVLAAMTKLRRLAFFDCNLPDGYAAVVWPTSMKEVFANGTYLRGSYD